MDNKNIIAKSTFILRFIIGILCIILGLILMVLWFNGQELLPGGSILNTTPLFILSIGIFLIIAGAWAISWNKIANTKNQTKKILYTSFVIIIILLGLLSYADISYRNSYSPPPPNPYILLTANPVNHSCTITVENTYYSSVQWANVWYGLGDMTNSKRIFNGTVAGTSNATIILPRTGQIKVGQTITISPAGAWTQGNPLDNKTQYEFGLIYNVTNGIIGEVSWTQP